MKEKFRAKGKIKCAKVKLNARRHQKPLNSYLESGRETVGTHVDVSHVAASPIGMTVRCESELVEVDGRRLVFRVTARDEKGLVGEGTHERFIIDEQKFASKARERKSKA